MTILTGNGLNRLATFTRGTLNGAGTAILKGQVGTMRCILKTESQDWLARLSVSWIEGHGLKFGNKRLVKVMTTVPNNMAQLRFFSEWIANWFPPSESKLLVISYWSDSPPGQSALFHKVRLGCGDSRNIDDAPGHIFDGNSAEDLDLLDGSLCYVIAHDWFGSVACESGKQFLYLGDDYLIFYFDDPLMEQELIKILDIFKLRQITDIKSAWESPEKE